MPPQQQNVLLFRKKFVIIISRGGDAVGTVEEPFIPELQ